MGRDRLLSMQGLAPVAALLIGLAGLAVSACAKVGPSNGASSSAGSGGLGGSWSMGCTSTAGIAGIAPPSSASYTSQIEINNTNLTYVVQGYTDGGCETAGDSVTYNFTIAPVGPDSVIPTAEDINLTATSTNVCTPGCVSDGQLGSSYLGLYQVSGNTLSINFAGGMRPTTLAYAFTQ